LQRDGRKSLTIEEMGLLATHPYLAASQRAEYAAMAQAAVGKTVQAQPADGELQRLIDEAADTAEYEEEMLDRLFFSRGEW
jgi:hypothetical protein